MPSCRVWRGPSTMWGAGSGSFTEKSTVHVRGIDSRDQDSGIRVGKKSRKRETMEATKGLVAEGKPRQRPKQEREGTSQLDPQANAHGNSVLAPTSEMDARVREQIRMDGGGSVDSMAASVRREEVHELLATREVEIARLKGDIVAINRRNGDARRIVEEDQAKMQQQLARLESKVSKLKKALDDERKSRGCFSNWLIRKGSKPECDTAQIQRKVRGDEERESGWAESGITGTIRDGIQTGNQESERRECGGMDTTLRDDLMAEIDKQVVRGESANPSLNNESTQSKASGWHDDTDETEERQARLLAPSLRDLPQIIEIDDSLSGGLDVVPPSFVSFGCLASIGMKILDTCFQESQLASDRSSDRPILALSPRMREMGQSNVADVFLRLASWALALSPCAGVSVGQHPSPARTSAKDARLLGDAGVYECSGIGAIPACIHTVMWYQANGWYPFRVLFSSLCVPECREANDHRICQPGPWTRAFTGYPRSTWAAEDVLDFKLGFSEMIRREILGLYWAKNGLQGNWILEHTTNGLAYVELIGLGPGWICRRVIWLK
ncbi:hypothetical protein C8J57DRAFT_1680940 [Mycena rebaudengoi]|nr:hypothetical protein C8J57DRAFT_1680940 [Mycena rebaudengoi]